MRLPECSNAVQPINSGTYVSTVEARAIVGLHLKKQHNALWIQLRTRCYRYCEGSGNSDSNSTTTQSHLTLYCLPCLYRVIDEARLEQLCLI